MSDGRGSHPLEGPEDFAPEPTSDEDFGDEGFSYADDELVYGDEEFAYGELPEVWDDPDVQDLPGDEEPDLLAEVTDAGVGPGLVVLSGPRVGTVVSRASGQLSAPTSVGSSDGRPVARPVMTASAALAPGEVLMLVHRPGTYAARVPHALARAHSDFSHAGLHLGVSANLPRKGESDTASYLASCGAASVRIADPEGYALPGDLVGDPLLTAPQMTKVTYVIDAPTVGEPASVDWNQRVIRSQRAAGANVLLTPGRTLDHNNAGPELEEAGRALDVLLDEVNGSEIPAWNLTLRASWLIDTNLRDQLLAELVDRDDVLVWHIRVRWPVNSKPYGQALQMQLLQGYRELAETARREDRALLLPNTGLTGWLSLGWGTVGFGTGSSQTTQAWKDKQIMRSKKGAPRPPAVQRHHTSSLLHTISVASHLNLAQTLPDTGYPPCGCTFCEQQTNAPSWLSEVEASHALYDMARLSARVAAEPRQSRTALIRRLVAEAELLRDGLPAASLDAKETPDHLPGWAAILA